MYEVKRRQGQLFLGCGTYTVSAEWIAASDYDALLADRDRLAKDLAETHETRDQLAERVSELEDAAEAGGFALGEEIEKLQAELSAAREAVETVNRRATAIVQWLQVNQRDVFKRGLWDALNGADRATDSAGAEHG